ncbi:unnamed protein product [Gongylonema pulchrum]|uniref:Peptidase A1 domain-containing protein n=1 Tax=Gongylonema pulchrum TaxID=637853 RepID=A0A183EBQ8_9BILA|nr:unnamed protein product [Gongylonema pulchrum]
MNVNIGDPFKEFFVLLETVTSRFWVVGIDCFDWLPFCHGKTKYLVTESKGARFELVPCNLNFDYKKAITFNPFRYTDQISVPEMNGAAAWKFENATFRTVSIVPYPILEEYQKISGVIGLARLNIQNEFTKNNPMRKAIHAGTPVITIALPKLDTRREAVLTVGGHDNKSCILGSALSESVILNERYDFTYLSIQMGSLKFQSRAAAVAYPHISNSNIGVPKEFMQKILRKTGAKFDATTNKYLVNCNANFDSLLLNTDSNGFAVEPEYFVRKHSVSFKFYAKYLNLLQRIAKKEKWKTLLDCDSQITTMLVL